MKKAFKWKTVLVGTIAAIIMTVVTGIIYTTYCSHLDSPIWEYVQVKMPVDSESENEEAQQVYTMVTIIRDKNGEDVVQLDGNPTLEVLRRLYGFQLVLFKELSASRLARNEQNPYIRYQDLFFRERPAINSIPSLSGGQNQEKDAYWRLQFENSVDEIENRVSAYLSGLEKNSFAKFNEEYNYWMHDESASQSPSFLTNSMYTDPAQVNLDDYAFLFQIRFDEHGVYQITDLVHTSDSEKLRRDINTVLHENPLELLGNNAHFLETGYAPLDEAIEKATKIKMPTECCCTIGMTWEKWQEVLQPVEKLDMLDYYNSCFGGTSARMVGIMMVLIIGVFGAIYLNPRSEDKRVLRGLYKAPIEIQVVLIYLLVLGWDVTHRWFAMQYLEQYPSIEAIMMFLFLLYLVVWYVGGSLGEIFARGFIRYFKEKCILVAVMAFVGRKITKLYKYFRKIDVGDNLRKKVIGLLMINAVFLSLFCCTWFFGIALVIIYSFVLYFIISKYISSVQKDYKGLRQMTQEMAEGNLKFQPGQSFGTFESVKDNLVKIRDSFDNAVQEEVRSHKMKTELITNVSHDLKTPLTAIITYINLMKDKDITDEMRVQYLDTLEKKSLRLKTLIEDLFEVSKANSGNIQLNPHNCDLVNLLKQIFFEMEDKLAERKLITRMNLPDEKVLVFLDGQKTFRIYENLFGNIAKYAMEGTRVYITLTHDEDTVTVTLKNITEAEIYVPVKDLTERFVRGDTSRGRVEGSGLGLAIVRSFTEIQGGRLEIEVDGDLFKVSTIWHKSWDTEDTDQE